MIAPWIGIDLDGTLAIYDGWNGPEHIGAPVPKMLKLVRELLADGNKVKIFTARVFTDGTPDLTEKANRARVEIVAWCKKYFERELEVTCMKDFGMILLYDDRCRQVETNTGRIIGGNP
jgi:hypothetical protein